MSIRLRSGSVVGTAEEIKQVFDEALDIAGSAAITTAVERLGPIIPVKTGYLKAVFLAELRRQASLFPTRDEIILSLQNVEVYHAFHIKNLDDWADVIFDELNRQLLVQATQRGLEVD